MPRAIEPPVKPLDLGVGGRCPLLRRASDCAIEAHLV
jgi:hypothetical protein